MPLTYNKDQGFWAVIASASSPAHRRQREIFVGDLGPAAPLRVAPAQAPRATLSKASQARPPRVTILAPVPGIRQPLACRLGLLGSWLTFRTIHDVEGRWRLEQGDPLVGGSHRTPKGSATAPLGVPSQ
eukprot:scaffold117333_cov42-Prasinocladus_malaysianus.AAC.2